MEQRDSLLGRIRRMYNGDRIEQELKDKRLYTSQKAFTLSKEDLLTIHSLGAYQYITPAEMLKEYQVYKLLDGLADNITDNGFIEMLNLVEDERELTAKSNEYLGRSLAVRNLITQRQDEWTNRVADKTLVSRLSRTPEAELKQLLQLPNKTLREAVESELIRRKKKVIDKRNKVNTYAITGNGEITYDITPEARGLEKIGALKR